MKNLCIISLTVIVLLFSHQLVEASQIHKCIGQGGVISYQQSPCVEAGETMLEKRGIVDGETYQQALQVLKGQLGDRTVTMLAFNWWKAFRKEFDGNMLHFKFTDDEGDTPISLLIDFIIPQSEEYLSDKEIRQFMSKKTELFFKTSVETKLNLEQLKLRDGFGYYQTFTDKNLVGKSSYPPGEFLYTTSGIMVSQNTMINFTLLSNNYTAENHLSAMSFLINGIDIEVGNASQGQPDDLSHLEQGLVAFLEHKVVDSVELFRLATEEEPENHLTWLSYCLALREVNRLQSAYVACDHANALKPDDLDLQHGLLNLMIKARDLDNAYLLSEKLINRSQSEPIADTIINLAFFAMVDGQLDLATKTFDLLTQKGLSSLKQTSDMATLAYLKGDKQQALKLIEELSEKSVESKEYVAFFKLMVSTGLSIYPPFYNEETYVDIPQRLTKLGTGALKNQPVDPWVKHMIPLKGVGLLQVNLPEAWVAMPQYTEQDENNNILSLKLFNPMQMTKLVVVDLGKVSVDWTMQDLEQQMRSSLKVFFDDEHLALQPLTGTPQGFQLIKTKVVDEVSFRVLNKDVLYGIVNLGVNATAMNADVATNTELDKIFAGIELIESDQTPLSDRTVSTEPKDESVTETKLPYEAVELPDSPDGYTWVRMPEAKAAFLKPDGWFEINKSTKDAVTYAISKEKITSKEQFTTGLTLIAAQDIESKIKVSPYRYALDLMLAIESDADNSIIKQNSKKQGPFDSLFIQYENNPPGLEPIVVHKMFIANVKTGSLYIVIFEAPKDEWDEAWKLGYTILKYYLIDDEF